MATPDKDKVCENAACAGEDAQKVEAEVLDASAETEEQKAEEPVDELAKAQEEAGAWKDKYYRLHAEWDTYRRRMNEQREEEKLRATEKLIAE